MSTEEKEVPSDEVKPALSKRAMKRLTKRQKYLDTRSERRQKEKAKRKQKQEEARVWREEHPEEAEGMLSYYQDRKRLKQCTMSSSESKVHVVIDLSFDHLMSQKDMGKTCKQILHCYSINRRLPNPMQFHLSSFEGVVEAEMDKNQGFRNWDIHFHKETYLEIAPKGSIIYLCAEADTALETLEQDTFYIIGGLVDHNLHKGLCHKKAVSQGIRTARLPIDEYIKLQTRKVLTIDHVFRIMASVNEGKSWKEAFLDVLPARKGVEEIQKIEFGSKQEEKTNLADND